MHRTRELFLLTDWRTGEPIYLDPNQIAFIQQIVADDTRSRRTRVDLCSGNQVFLVKEEASQIALASGRGFFNPKEFRQPT
jgi:hypothetical protein